MLKFLFFFFLFLIVCYRTMQGLIEKYLKSTRGAQAEPVMQTQPLVSNV